MQQDQQRPIAARRWPMGARQMVQPSTALAVVPSSSGGASYIVLSDDDSDDDRSRKKQRTSAALAGKNLDAGVSTSNAAGPGNYPHLLEEEIVDDSVVTPDERWKADDSALALYRAPMEFDWVVVSESNEGDDAGPSGAAASDDNPGSDLELEPVDEEDLDERAAGERVANLLQAFEKIRLKEKQKAEASGGGCYSSNKAWNVLKGKGMLMNRRLRIGPVPGIEVGQMFVFRCELMLVGLHNMSQHGIGTIPASNTEYGMPVACSIVLSGTYEDDHDDGETFTYTGQGGRDGNGKHIKDQTLTAGNLALANSCKLQLPVRVTRGNTQANSPTGKIYSYDGFYRVLKYWSEIGKSGFIVQKYMLERLPDQAELGSRLVEYAGKLKSKQICQKNVVCNDISGGQEPIPIVAVNDVDVPAVAPSGYTYITKIIYPVGFQKPGPPAGCKCKGHCGNGQPCRCISRNGGRLPYNKDGTLPEWKTVIYECGPLCGCSADCPNRVSQRPLQYKFEVFKTHDRGWGVRSWDSIPYGSFICEYVGEMITSEEAEKRVGNDEYIFDIDCIRGSKNRGVDVSCYVEEPAGGELAEEFTEDMSIDAVSFGNFTRFINHSCRPNIFVQCVFHDHTDFKVPHIMMFAAKHIRPLEELAYDYGYALDSVTDTATGVVKQKQCKCGARGCRKRLY